MEAPKSFHTLYVITRWLCPPTPSALPCDFQCHKQAQRLDEGEDEAPHDVKSCGEGYRKCPSVQAHQPCSEEKSLSTATRCGGGATANKIHHKLATQQAKHPEIPQIRPEFHMEQFSDQPAHPR